MLLCSITDLPNTDKVLFQKSAQKLHRKSKCVFPKLYFEVNFFLVYLVNVFFVLIYFRLCLNGPAKNGIIDKLTFWWLTNVTLLDSFPQVISEWEEQFRSRVSCFITETHWWLLASLLHRSIESVKLGAIAKLEQKIMDKIDVDSVCEPRLQAFSAGAHTWDWDHWEWAIFGK